MLLPQPIYADLINLRGDFAYNQVLGALTTWKVGGLADYYFRPHNLLALREFMQIMPLDLDLYFLGLGSNVLVRDTGVSGVVVHTHKGLNQIKLLNEDQVLENLLNKDQVLEKLLNKDQVLEKLLNEEQDFEKLLTIKQKQDKFEFYAEAGVPCAKIAKLFIEAGCKDGAFFAGIPGTVGGALAMNAGAFKHCTWDFVKNVTVIDRLGNIKVRDKSEYNIGYRSLQIKSKINAAKQNKEDNYIEKNQEWFVGAHLVGYRNATADEAKAHLYSLLQQRKQTQPTWQKTCGSVFKNPCQNFAAKLIELSNLKSHAVGDAIVSPLHANFIINLGNASSNDIENLIKQIQNKVALDHQVDLQLEVNILGELSRKCENG